MAETSSEDRTEAATPRRIEKAREEGQVPRSRELSTFIMLLAGIAGLWGMGGHLYDRLGGIVEQALLFDRAQLFDTSRMLGTCWSLGQSALLALVPFFALMVFAALAAPALIGGLVITGGALRPRFSRLDPISGMARLFSVQVPVELAKAIAKTALIGTVLYLFLDAHLGQLLGLPRLPPQQALAALLGLTAKSCATCVGALIVVVGMDTPYQLWTYARNLRMTKEEIRQEHKNSDGDPHVKARIRRLQQARARRRMMSKVPRADVVVTNPSHFAVALSYRKDKDGAPRVIAKGADAVALRIREIALEHDLPILEAPPLARALYFHVDLDRLIPMELYTVVAEVVAWAIRLKRVSEYGGPPPPAPHNLNVPEGMDQPGRRARQPEDPTTP
ncbi:flagellar biosynthesis protein FlhB [Pseudomonas sp. 148P]|uniref:Flagellar biosynthetic protein FlhB n=1 Tax=Pseudomonas ulcerans TaxID=3115852 RepID=A0ABU7HJH5_9PSED|nr:MULTISPECIES: flagellar biosynthesis protein FlhB [unclassified Pseudomonas]MEE1921404.1 flagellar biosynthesis protein FlhB [Pseudomonas sp. 147P]MEE1931687.1 flagellar biosynthesis protein FlhB [Pseudomonas sp. 148P]